MSRKSTEKKWTSPDGLLWIEGWARDGLTMAQIAERMGVSEATLYRWVKRYPEMDEAIERGRGPADVEIENALHRLAKGYIVKLKKPVKLRTEIQEEGRGKSVKERIEYVEEEVYVKPDARAQIHWLQNRKPGQWGKGPKVEAEIKSDEALSIMAEVRRQMGADNDS